MLSREFYQQSALELAPQLLGKTLVHKTPEGTASGIIVETEAYAGIGDKGSHSCSGVPTARTAIQFGPGGCAYTYMLYGMYFCFNVVVGPEGSPQVVLVRALEPLEGIELMRLRRHTEKTADLCNGPGKLCQALDIGKAQYGLDLCGEELFLEDGPAVPHGQIFVSPRINIDYAEECAAYPWRFYRKDSPFVSKVPKKYAAAAKPWRKN